MVEPVCPDCLRKIVRYSKRCGLNKEGDKEIGRKGLFNNSVGPGGRSYLIFLSITLESAKAFGAMNGLANSRRRLRRDAQ